MRRVVLAIVLLMFLNGCAAVMTYKLLDNKSKKEMARRQFTEAFQAQNLTREREGLEPLDWCTEVSRFDPGWADDIPECRQKLGLDSRF